MVATFDRQCHHDSYGGHIHFDISHGYTRTVPTDMANDTSQARSNVLKTLNI